MTDVLTVPTHFGDLSELSHGLIDRVDDGRIILYGPTMFDQGAHVGFRVLLSDESTALEGYGRVTEVYDGGEEREPEIRYDTVLESLELDGRNEVVFERIVLARLSLTGEDPPTGEVDISELAEEDAGAAAPAFDDATEFSNDVPADDLAEAVDFAAPDDLAGDFSADVDVSDDLNVDVSDVNVAPPEFPAPAEYEATDFEDVADDAFESLAPASPMEAAPVEPPPMDPAPLNAETPVHVAPPRVPLGVTDGPLVRPVFAASWWPRAESPEPGPSTGWFQYAAGALPVPPQAPRPELSPELRVTPAPRPGAEKVQAPAPVASEAFDAGAEPPDVPMDAPMEDGSSMEAVDELVAFDASGEAPATSDATESDLGEEPSPFDEMPLPDRDAEIAPAVEPEYVSVGDAHPVSPEESFADVDVSDMPMDQGDDDVDVELDL